jgi:paraquat-inducible protein A
MSATTGRLAEAAPRASTTLWATPARLRECMTCGQVQTVPSLIPGTQADCLRCGMLIRRGMPDPLGRALALNCAALALLVVALVMPLMTVSTAGMTREATLLSGPRGMGASGLWPLEIMVLFTTAAAPAGKLALMTYVLARLRLPRPPRFLRRLYALALHLRAWAMIEVFLIGVAVAYSKLIDLVHLDLGIALLALFLLMVTMIAADYVLDRQAVWEAMEARGVPPADIDHVATTLARPEEGAVACHTCQLVCSPSTGHVECPRCGSHLHPRKPNSIARTWALLIAAAVLYIPANYYPVLQFIQFGSGAPSTILGGVVELVDSGLLGLAALVFFASVAVPMMKLAGLITLLILTQRRTAGRLRARAHLYYIVEAIGRWSMIDIFMETILVALVQFGGIVRIEPGIGAVAFCSVVVLTMLAAESFDPRLMWDAAGQNRVPEEVA